MLGIGCPLFDEAIDLGDRVGLDDLRIRGRNGRRHASRRLVQRSGRLADEIPAALAFLEQLFEHLRRQTASGLAVQERRGRATPKLIFFATWF
jgi:hypothetical protein